MAYSKYPTKYEKPRIVTADYLIMKWQNIAVLGSRLAMAIEGNAPQNEINKLAKQYNELYAEAIKKTQEYIMSSWNEIGIQNAKIANEEMRLKGEAIKSSSQTASLAQICADISDIKVLLNELINHIKNM